MLGLNIDRLPPYSVFALYIVSASLWSTATRCATHWKLEDGEVNIIYDKPEDIFAKDPLFKILTTSIPKNPVKEKENASSDIFIVMSDVNENLKESDNIDANSINGALVIKIPASKKFKSAGLTCGDPVNKSIIDHLDGVADRFNHPPFSEPEVALLFRKNEFDDVNLNAIELNLLDALKSKEKEVILYNQIANFLRISGDTYHAIECFRKVLEISHDNQDALLNLARMLFNLRYTKDAIYLAERSLDHHSADRSTWLQHYALGEFFEGNNEYERALSHYQMALDQNPAFHPALTRIKRLAKVPSKKPTNVYTFFLIATLCMCFIIYLYHYILKEPKTDNDRYSINNTTKDNNNGTNSTWRSKKQIIIKR